MEPYLLCLRTKEQSKRPNRWYCLWLLRDLFGGWLLITQWGQEEQEGEGRKKQYVFEDEMLARRKFEEILKRRLTPQRHGGCTYYLKPEDMEKYKDWEWLREFYKD